VHAPTWLGRADDGHRLPAAGERRPRVGAERAAHGEAGSNQTTAYRSTGLVRSVALRSAIGRAPDDDGLTRVQD
jgi:hypothetical protein